MARPVSIARKGVPMSVRKSWDLVVIGGGTAGMVTATQFARSGGSVALIEASRTGGDCLYTGCVPSKALLASARIAYTVRRAADFGIQVDAPEIDFAAIMRRKDDIIASIAPQHSPEALAEAGVTVIHGHAHFVDSQTVRVGQDLHIGDQFVIATGSVPKLPDIIGLRKSRMVTTETILDLTTLPHRLVVIGAGFSGLELGQAFARFGSEVTIVARGTRIARQAEPDYANRLQGRLEDEGIRFALETTITSVETEEESDVSVLKLEHASGEHTALEADRILVATGRRPNIAHLGLDNAGIAVTNGQLELDDLSRTNLEHIWACGDVTGAPNLTHRAEDQARTLAGNLLGGADRWNGAAIPWALFTDPPIASIGLSRVDARAALGDRLEVLRFPYSQLDRAITDGDADGEIMVLLKPGWTGGRGGGEIVGAHIIGAQADELINQFAPMLTWRLPAGMLSRAVQVYPTHGLGVRQAVGLHWSRGDHAITPSLLSRMRRWWRD